MLIRAPVIFALLVLMSGASSAQTATKSSKPTDPQIAHIAYTAGVIDIDAAKLALGKSKNKQVVGFAEGMVRDHEAVNGQALDLAKKLKVTPEDNAYMQNEVAYHKQVNNALKTQLIPSATNDELKGLLETGLILFQGHQQHAEDVAATLK